MQDDITRLELAVERMNGNINTLTAEFKAGDRNGEAGVRLLAQQVKVQGDAQVQQAKDIRDMLASFNVRTEQLATNAAAQASAVRVDMERKLEVHENADAPHARSLGARLEKVESRVNRVWGGLAVLGFIGLSGVAALVKAFGG